MAGNKLKNHSGAKKRFSRTGTGKLMHRKVGRRHLLTSKRPSRKGRLQRAEVIPKTVVLTINRMLPY